MAEVNTNGMQFPYEGGYCDHADPAGQVCVVSMQTASGESVVRIMRLHVGREPDFLLADGRWWRVAGDMRGSAYCLPDGATSHPVHTYGDGVKIMQSMFVKT